MNGYRLYYMDRFSGHIDHRRDFVAAGDKAAIEVANGWTTEQPMELWQAGRKVKRWEAAATMPVAPIAYAMADLRMMPGEAPPEHDRL